MSILIWVKLNEDVQTRQLRKELESVDFEIHDLENKFLSADPIKENLKAFRGNYDHLTIYEKHDLLHLLIKKIVCYEEPETDARMETRRGNKNGSMGIATHRSI